MKNIDCLNQMKSRSTLSDKEKSNDYYSGYSEGYSKGFSEGFSQAFIQGYNQAMILK